ncbi:MAG: hypothetical protein ACRESI_01210 [Gammaproteobacteria bacterium]
MSKKLTLVENLDASLKAETDDDGVFEVADTATLIEPGWYQAVFDTWETRLTFGKAPKVYFWFDVITFDMETVKIARYFNVAKLIGPQRIRGRFVASRYSDLVRTYCALFNPSRLDRLSLSRFTKVRNFRVEVQTVARNKEKQIIADAARYSVITQITFEPNYENA